MTTAATRLVAVIGDPIDHSRSPQLHSAAIAAAGVDAVYVALQVTTAGLDAAIAGLRAVGFLGCNVTLPHKAAVMGLVDDVTDEAAFIGAANCLHWDGDRLIATNTDCEGVRAVLADDCGVREGTTVTILGTGGAARATAVACGRLGAAVSVSGRRPDAEQALTDLALRAGAVPSGVGTSQSEVIVNATPIGRHGEVHPDEFMHLGPGRVALDLNYESLPSPFLASAAAAGGLAVDGLGMLVGQAEESFALWFRRPPPPGVMRAAGAAARV